MLLTLAVFLSCQPIAARASVVCENLRIQLASEPEVIADTGEMRRYSSAIARQNMEIRKVQHDLRRLGCGGSIVVYGSDGRNQCDELSNTLARMQANKLALAAKRDGLRDTGSDSNPRRQHLLAALESNGCNAEQPAEPSSAAADRVIRPAAPEPDTQVGLSPQFQAPTGHGSLRTLCVRTCDGAFFPISSNTSPLNFRRDTLICQQMCPDTETELYYHSIRTAESADMVSAETGRPYRSLPTAFAYLNRASGEQPACSCDFAGYYRRLQGQNTPHGIDGQNDKAVIHVGGTTSGTASRETGAAEPATPAERTYDPASTIRQVGPTFLPTGTGSIDLRNPAVPGLQPLQQQ
ncbi:hypothetical protein GCM10007920_02540 [Ciceribacter naphthalenivorans]|uniref:DUF2865 domain-containing protein n=1 Tax=Sphingomonas psychrolutea TaxID=1259676 RepID=A0ABQ6E6B2_9SPHN|nr:hypothetical protein GCM10007920_02540 [Ciceribacter naphthalenivorans]GLT03326.1 hypothetical protein GCM10007926_02540 [Sphingomonas psychrolutea]